MHPAPVTLRRARRTDFVAVMRVLASNDLPVPPPDRATLRRFRRLVADLGADFYVAVSEAQVVGFVHVSYTRQLAGAARARIETLAVHGECRGRGVGSALLELVCMRARRRTCAELLCAAGGDRLLAEFLSRRGWVPGAELLRLALVAEAPEVRRPPARMEAST